MIRIEHLCKVYPNVTPLKDVNCVINDGDVISVIGPSGTGKSTLLRCINQLENPTSGKVWLDDIEITSPTCNINEVRKRMGMVFQSFNLFGHRTVIENVMLPPIELLGKSKQESYNNAMHLLREVGLAEKALNYPDELSGGQKQRIAIARTLAMDPDVILFDEPTSALDPTMVGEVQAVIQELSHTGKTILIVTHEMAFARAICNRVFYMDEGGIYEDGSPAQVFDNPQRENTRRFVHRLKVLELEIESRDYDYVAVINNIEQYGQRSQMSPRLVRRMTLACEELAMLLDPVLELPHLSMVVEYSADQHEVVLTMRYSGPAYDITKEGDELAISVLRGIASRLEYRPTEDADQPNEVLLAIHES